MHYSKFFISNITLLLFALQPLILKGAEISPQDLLKNYFRVYRTLDAPIGKIKPLVTGSFIYLCDQKKSEITIYRKDNGKRVASFGQKGEGPSDMDYIVDIRHANDLLYICSSKLSIFSSKGVLHKNVKKTAARIYRTFIPLGSGYVAKRYDYSRNRPGKNTLLYVLLNQDLKREKKLFRTTFQKCEQGTPGKRKICFFQHCRKAVVENDLLFIGCTDQDFYIGIFDRNGERVSEIKKPYNKIRVTREIKDRILKSQRRAFGEEYYKTFMEKYDIAFPEFLPAFVNFFVQKGKIYVFKYPSPASNWKVEALMLDIKGNVLSKLIIPLGAAYIHLEEKQNTSFYDGVLYIVSANEDDNVVITTLDVAGMFRDKS